MSAPKRLRTPADKPPPLPSSLTSIKSTNPALYAWRLSSHMLKLPSHPTSASGWWCVHPTLMRDLLNYMAEQPDSSEQTIPWLQFRRSVAKQLAHCRNCAREYHKALAEWGLDLTKNAAKKLATRRIRALVAWDLERLHPKLKNSPLLASNVANQTVTIADAREAENTCREAFLECLLSFRVCNNPAVSETIGELFKRGSVVRTIEDMKPFLVELGVLPSGHMALCFHPAYTVRAWARRVIAEVCPNPGKADVNARNYLFRKAVRVLPRQTKDAEKPGNVRRILAEARKVAWEGFGAIFKYLRRKHIRNFEQTMRKGELFEIFINGLIDVDEAIVAIATECAMTMLKELLPGELCESEYMSVDAALETVVKSFYRGRKAAAKARLIYLLPLIVTKSQGVASKRDVPRLFCRCYGVVEDAYKSSGGYPGHYGETLLQNGSGPEKELHRVVLRTGASLFKWYYSHAVPSPPFADPKKIAHFVLAVLRAEPRSSWAWDLLRTVLFTDVFSILGCMLKTSDVEGIGDILRIQRPESAALRDEEAVVIKNAVRVTSSSKNVLAWVGSLWSALEDGKHLKTTVEIQSNPVPLQEVKILLDLHQVIGLVDPACTNKRNDQTNSAKLSSADGAPSAASNFDVVCERIESVHRTIRVRFLKACAAAGNQQWWDQLPFHATHLLASSDKEVANKTFAALTRYRNLVGATCSGSRSKLLASDLKGDPDGGLDMADGCLSALRMVSALGSSTSMRTYASLLTWYRVLVERQYPKLMDDENCNWILGLILTFLRGWKRFERTTERVVFSEVCCRFLANLRNVWNMLAKVDGRKEDADSEEVDEIRQVMLNGILKGLFSMNTLQGPMARGSWTTTVCELASSWKDVQEFRENMVLIIQYHEAQRSQLSLQQCQRIADQSHLKEVNRPLQRWIADSRRGASQGTAGKKLQTKLDQFSSRIVSEDGMIPSRLVERKAPGVSFIGSGFSMKAASKKFSASRAVNRALGPSTAMNELRREVRGSHNDTARIAGKRNSHTDSKTAVVGGKTKFELLVEQQQAKKKKGNEMKMADRSEPSRVIRDLKVDQEAEQERDRTAPVIEISADNVSEEAEEDLTLPSWRRSLSPRMKEQLYRQVLQANAVVALNRDSWKRNTTGTPDRFDDVESYVSYWEPLIISELKASLQSLVTEEKDFAAKQTPDDYRGCRTAFMVEGPIESVGYIQNLSLQYCDELKKDQVPFERGVSDSQFDVTKVQTSDIVLLNIPPSKYARTTEQSLGSTTALGLVVKIVRNAGSFRLKLSVAFEHVDTAPGKGRQVMLSKLTGLTTFHRQLDGLYGLPDLSDGPLWNVLEPQRSLEIKHRLCEDQRSIVEDAVVSRLGFVQRLQSQSTLNNSQAIAIEDVIRACAPVFRPKLRLQAFGGDVNAHGSMTLIQGPPGTGKTSTIVGLLSALLLPGGEERPWRRTRVKFEDGSLVMPLAPVRVLVCAPSNAAVDEIMHRLMECGLQASSGCKASPRMVRVGGGTTRDSIRKLELRSLADEFISGAKRHGGSGSSANMAALRGEIESLTAKISALEREEKELASNGNEEIEALDDTSRAAEGEYKKLTAKLRALQDRYDDELENMLSKSRSSSKNDEATRKREVIKRMSRFLNSCSVVFATLSSAGHEILQNFGAKPDVIVIDEAAQCGEPEVLIPMTATRAKGASHVVLVGDPKQLPATVISRNKVVARALGRSLFERVGEACPLGVHMLNTQYRMHPAIASFPNHRFYSGRLLNGSNVTSDEMSPSFHQDPQKRFGPCTFLDTSQGKGEELRSSGGSLYNMQEAKVVICAITALLKGYENGNLKGQIAVLSPYRQQVLVLKRLLTQNSVLREAAVEVSTIDGIQGREKAIVFISTVRSGQSRSIGFVDDERRMNVALTRARHTLIVVGNAAALEKHSELWKAFISHCRSQSRLSVLPGNPEEYFPESRRKLTKTASRISTSTGNIEGNFSKKKKVSKLKHAVRGDADVSMTSTPKETRKPSNVNASKPSKRNEPARIRDCKDASDNTRDTKRLRLESRPVSRDEAVQNANTTQPLESTKAAPRTPVRDHKTSTDHRRKPKGVRLESRPVHGTDVMHKTNTPEVPKSRADAMAVSSTAPSEGASKGPVRDCKTVPLKSQPLCETETTMRKTNTTESPESRPDAITVSGAAPTDAASKTTFRDCKAPTDTRRESKCVGLESRPVSAPNAMHKTNTRNSLESRAHAMEVCVTDRTKAPSKAPVREKNSMNNTRQSKRVRLESRPVPVVEATPNRKESPQARSDLMKVSRPDRTKSALKAAETECRSSEKKVSWGDAPGVNLKRGRDWNATELPAGKMMKTSEEPVKRTAARSYPGSSSENAAPGLVPGVYREGSVAPSMDGDKTKEGDRSTSKGTSETKPPPAISVMERLGQRVRAKRYQDAIAERDQDVRITSTMTGEGESRSVPNKTASVFQRLGQRVHATHEPEPSSRPNHTEKEAPVASGIVERQPMDSAKEAKYDPAIAFCREIPPQACSRKSGSPRSQLEKERSQAFPQHSTQHGAMSSSPERAMLNKGQDMDNGVTRSSAVQPPAFPYSLAKARVDMEQRHNGDGRDERLARVDDRDGRGHGFRGADMRNYQQNNIQGVDDRIDREERSRWMDSRDGRGNGFRRMDDRDDRSHGYPRRDGWEDREEHLRWRQDRQGQGQGERFQRRDEASHRNDRYHRTGGGWDDRFRRPVDQRQQFRQADGRNDQERRYQQMGVRDQRGQRFQQGDVMANRDEHYRQRRR